MSTALDLLLIAALGWAGFNLRSLALRVAHVPDAQDHRDCIEWVALRTDAAALRAAADRWDSVDSSLDKTRLMAQYTEGGPGLPSLWLRDEADRLEGRRAS